MNLLNKETPFSVIKHLHNLLIFKICFWKSQMKMIEFVILGGGWRNLRWDLDEVMPWKFFTATDKN